VTDIAKAGGEKWKSLDESTKEKYEKKAKAAKEAYDVEYKEWLESGGAQAIKDAKKAAKAEKSGGEVKSSPKKKVKKTEITGGTGSSFQSKEFIRTVTVTRARSLALVVEGTKVINLPCLSFLVTLPFKRMNCGIFSVTTIVTTNQC